MKQTEEKKTGGKLKWYVLGALILLCLLYFAVPTVRAYVNQAAAVLGSANVDAVVDYIRSYGPYAMAISFALMVFSSVVAPLPAFLITFSNAAIFGWWQGAILSWSSAMAGAALCFFIARALGRDTVEKFAGRGALAGVEDYFAKYGSRTILICRLLPFVSFDTGIGQLPATVVYSYVGGMLTGGVKYFVTALLCIFALSILVMIIKNIYTERQAKKGDGGHG